MSRDDFETGCESSNTAWRFGIILAAGVALAGIAVGAYVVYRVLS